MNSRSLKLEEFIVEYPLWGDWEVSYTDGTHLQPNEYVKLGVVTIDASEQTARDHPILPFTFRPETSEKIECCFFKLLKKEQQANKTKQNQNQPAKQNSQESTERRANRAKKLIRDELADSVIRTGILRPNLCLMQDRTTETDFLTVMKQVSKYGSLISVVDTSALRRGAPSFLHKTLSQVQIWTIVPVFVMTEVQRQVTELNAIWTASKNNPKLKNYKVLGKRPQVSTISRELSHLRQWRPVEILTTLPEHLGQSNGQSKIDRLIIESVKNLKRDRGLHHGVYLLTGDKDMASLATLENQASLHIDVPSLPSEISSTRYNPYSSRLVLTPIHYLLWDLTQVFSTIRLKKKHHTYKLCYYSQSRGGFFAREVLEITEC